MALNCKNTCGFFNGDWEDSPAAFSGVRWSREPCQYPGVSSQHHINIKYYWTNFEVEFNKYTAKWGNSELSVLARGVCVQHVSRGQSFLRYANFTLCTSEYSEFPPYFFVAFSWRSVSETMRPDDLFRSV